MWIAHCIFQQNFLDDARFASARFLAVTIRPDGMHLDFARGIAAEHGTVLNEHDARSVACRRERSAHAGQAAPRNQEIGVKAMWGQQRHRKQGLSLTATGRYS